MHLNATYMGQQRWQFVQQQIAHKPPPCVAPPAPLQQQQLVLMPAAALAGFPGL
jgi:hypothetical protein